MITEIDDIQRFQTSRKLIFFLEMVIREYSSGGKHNLFGITKHRNPYLRTVFVEPTQRVFRSTNDFMWKISPLWGLLFFLLFKVRRHRIREENG